MPLLAPSSQIPTRARLIGEVSRIKSAPRRLADILIREWETNFDLLWTEANGVTPAQRVEALGTDAAELFAANAALVQFLLTMLAGQDDATAQRIAAKMASLPTFIINQDGTVTLT